MGFAVIPDCRAAASPESISPVLKDRFNASFSMTCDYGFRARGLEPRPGMTGFLASFGFLLALGANFFRSAAANARFAHTASSSGSS
jgi:hypothetical protein